MFKTNWTRARALNRPTKKKLAEYDRQNELAAAVILRTPAQHTPGQLRGGKFPQQAEKQPSTARLNRKEHKHEN